MIDIFFVLKNTQTESDSEDFGKKHTDAKLDNYFKMFFFTKVTIKSAVRTAAVK